MVFKIQKYIENTLNFLGNIINFGLTYTILRDRMLKIVE